MQILRGREGVRTHTHTHTHARTPTQQEIAISLLYNVKLLKIDLTHSQGMIDKRMQFYKITGYFFKMKIKTGFKCIMCIKVLNNYRTSHDHM